MRADWTPSGACTRGSTAPPRGATRRASGGAATTSTRRAERSRGRHGAFRGGIPMRIGIIGAGAVGGTLARRLAERGHQVSIANSRGPESLAALAAEIGAMPVSVVDAANTGGFAIISIPTKAVLVLPRDLFDNEPSSVVVFETVHYQPDLL